MKKLFLTILLMCLSTSLCMAQFSIGISGGYSKVGYTSFSTSSSSPYLFIQLSPGYTFKNNWGVAGDFGWYRIASDSAASYRNAAFYIEANHRWIVGNFLFRIGAGPAARLRLCYVDGAPLSLITTLKVGLGLKPHISYNFSERSSVFISSLLETHFYDPLGAYYTQGLGSKFMWAWSPAIGYAFTF